MRVRFPTPHHEDLLEAELAGLRADPGVLGVMLCGSLARGTARENSDIDLLVVLADGEAERARRKRHGSLTIEEIGRTSSGWVQRFSPSRVGDESWGYAFLEGIILHDPHGVVARLVSAAADAHASYRVSRHIKAHYAWLWDHVRPKMEAVLRGNDATEIGWAVAVMTNPLVETLWAINERPLPSRDLGRFERHLDDLTVPDEASALVHRMLRSSPREALRLQLRLLDLAVPYLRRGDAADPPET